MIQGPKAAQPSAARLADADLFAVVECEAKWVAEGGKRPLRGVGLGSFKRKIMCLPWGRGLAFACTRAFPHDLYFSGPHADPHFGGIGCSMIVDRSRRSTRIGGKRSAVPGVVAEDAVGLSDDVPAFDIMKVSSVGFARLDVLRIELCS